MENCVEASTFHQPKMFNDNNHIPRARQPFLPIQKFMSRPLLPSASKIRIHSTWTKRHGHRRLWSFNTPFYSVNVSPMQISQIMTSLIIICHVLNQKCSMTITIFLGLDNHFYLSKNSCLDHCYHPGQKSESILRGQKDMDTGDFDLLTLLF